MGDNQSTKILTVEGNIIGLRDVPDVDDCLSTLADYHAKAVRDDFIQALGTFFLRNVLYKGALKSANANVYVCLENGMVAGHIIYAYDTGKFLQEIFLKRCLFAGITFLTKVLVSYRMLRKCFQALRCMFSGTEDVKCEILMILVDPEYRGKSIGSRLLHSMYDDLSKRQITVCKLRVLKDNSAAIGLYEKNGWKEVAIMSLMDREWIEMIRHL